MEELSQTFITMAERNRRFRLILNSYEMARITQQDRMEPGRHRNPAPPVPNMAEQNTS